jgi:hypothetical protein
MSIKYKNKYCLGCQRKCKQTDLVTVVKCPIRIPLKRVCKDIGKDSKGA